MASLRFLDGDRELSRADEVEIVVREKLSLADAEVPGFAELVAKAKPGKPLTATISDLKRLPTSVRGARPGRKPGSCAEGIISASDSAR